jgi:hypothetical protein
MPVPPLVVQALTLFVALCVIVAFGALFGWAMWISWKKGQTPVVRPEMVYVATALAGLVGTGVAKSFGQKLPTPPASLREEAAPGGVDVHKTVRALNDLVAPRVKGHPSDVPMEQRAARYLTIAQTVMVAIYALVYIVFGIAAIVTWCVKGAEQTHDIVKNLACISLGLFLAIAGSIFPAS